MSKRKIIIYLIIFCFLFLATLFLIFFRQKFFNIGANSNPTCGNTNCGINASAPVLLYSDNQMPYTMDANFATLKQDDNTMCFFESGGTTQKYCGSSDNPLKTFQWKKNMPTLWNMQGFDPDNSWNVWLKNIYQIDNHGDLLGFVHIETNRRPTNNPPPTSDVRYIVGLGFSSDNGDSWTYLGNIIKPQNDSSSSVVAGVPILAVGNYFYVYYNDYPTGGSKRVSVARALIADVVNAAEKKTVSSWEKYNNGSWTQDGLTGVGSNIITTTAGGYPMNGDAVYDSTLNRYFITTYSTESGTGKLLLYSSIDGINWENPIVIAQAAGRYYPYSTFVSFASDASADSNKVGTKFYILIDSKNVNNYNDDELYSSLITATAPTTASTGFGSAGVSTNASNNNYTSVATVAGQLVSTGSSIYVLILVVIVILMVILVWQYYKKVE
jgi:hypothetical protein